MNLNENLLSMFAKAVNTTNEKETKLYYGTITRIDESNGVRVPYVHLDGSEPNSETPLVEGTEVMVDDRVIVTIENHKAVVMSNVTSPASARTAKNYMDLVIEEGDDGLNGLKIGVMNDGEHDFNVLVANDGIYIRDGRKVLSKYIRNGIEFGLQEYEDEEGTTRQMFSHLSEGWLELFSDYAGYDNYSAVSALCPGLLRIEDSNGGSTEIYGGRIDTTDSALFGGYIQTTFKGDLSLGTCCVPVTYTSSGTTMHFTIPMPFRVTSSLNFLYFTCAVRCNGHYLVQLSPTTHAAAPIQTGQTSTVYCYNGSDDVETRVTLTATNYPTGILCTMTFSPDSISNGCNNHAAVAMLYNIQARFA